MSTQSPVKPRRELRRVVAGGNFLKPKKWEDWAVGDFVEGTFEQAVETDLYGKPIYEIRVSDKKITGSDPTILTGERAGIMPLYNNGSMQFQMNQLSFGDFVRIEYKGMATTSKGKFKGKPCHNVEIQSDAILAEEAGDLPESDILG